MTTYAPQCLKRLRAYAIEELGADPQGVGIIGDKSHQGGYHIGWSDLARHKGWHDWSAALPRDRMALKGETREAACALDLTCGSRGHRRWLIQLVRDLLAGEPYTRPLRAVNGTLDGKRAYRWDREAGFRRAPTDSSHLFHTHLEFYRDSIAANANLLPILTEPMRGIAKFKRPAGLSKAAAAEQEELGVSAEQKLDALLELLTFGTRSGLTATSPDKELGSGYIAVSLRLAQQTAHRMDENNRLLRELIDLHKEGKA